MKAINTACLFAAAALAVMAAGCGNAGIYGKVKPEYDLVANQDKKVLIWVEAPRSAAADVDAAEKLAASLYDHLVARARIKPDNVQVQSDSRTGAPDGVQTPEAAAQQAGTELVLMVRIEEYELLPLNIRDYYFGRMLTRALLLDVQSNRPVWPKSEQGKVHDIAIELGQGGRVAVLSQMSASTAHCIVRNLYPIVKMYYKNSDERISVQEAFEMETF